MERVKGQEYLEDMRNDYMPGEPLEIITKLAYGQKVWTLMDTRAVEATVIGCRGEAPHSHASDLEIKLRFVFGEFACDEYRRYDQVFLDKEALMSHIFDWA